MLKRTQTERVAQAAKRRKLDYEAKRFNNPLKIFIERKYPQIFEEFTAFYNFVNFVNPGKKDLTKTTTFKQWVVENPIPLKNIIPLTVVSASPSETSSTTVSARSSETSSTMVSARSSETSSTMVSARLSETSSTSTTVSANPNEVNTISDLLDELFGPDGIPDEILPDETLSNEDEGIELNHFDELTFDIEPFDFLTETEGF